MRIRLFEQNLVEEPARDGINNFFILLAISEERKLALRIMDHAAFHGDSDLHHLVFQANLFKRPPAARGKRKIDRTTRRNITTTHICAAFVHLDAETFFRQINRHQRADKPTADNVHCHFEASAKIFANRYTSVNVL